MRVPRYRRGGGNYQKLERKVGDYATVGVATHLEMDDGGTITRAGIALTSVYAHNLKVTEAEELLVGKQPSPELFAEAAQVANRRATRSVTSGARPSTTGRRQSVHRAGARRLGRDRRGVRDMEIEVTVNGAAHTADVEPRLLLVTS